MSILLLLLIGAPLLLIAYLWSTYNSFVSTENRIEAAIQEIGNQMKRQAELIPNLISSVKGYMKHEKSVFKEITEARKQVMSAVKSEDLQKMVQANDKLQNALGSIRAVFEDTPEIKADQPTEKLMDELRDTADKVMYARRTLIDLTVDYNNMIEMFPSNIIAGIFNFKEKDGLTINASDFLEVTQSETKTPKVDLEN
jgi:LemA protein